MAWHHLRAGIRLTRGVQGDDLDVGGPAASRAVSYVFISAIEHLLRADVSPIADGSLRDGREFGGHDILPAAQLGMRTIRVAIEEPAPADSAADAVATSLHDVQAVLRAWVQRPDLPYR